MCTRKKSQTKLFKLDELDIASNLLIHVHFKSIKYFLYDGSKS